MNFLGLPSDMIGRILLAGLIGALAGIERDISGRPSGLRTNMVIAISSCLITILSIDVFMPMSTQADVTRMTAAIVSGIGFLGAGVILHHRADVRGLTSAADIWLVAGIGIAIGARMYHLAVFVSIFTIVALISLSPVSYFFASIGQRRNRHWKEKNSEKPSSTCR